MELPSFMQMLDQHAKRLNDLPSLTPCPGSIASRIHSSAETGNDIDDFFNTVTGVTHPAL